MVEPYPNEEGNMSHSYRGYSPDYIDELWENANDHHEEARVRETLRFIEDGRFHEMLDDLHNMISFLDRDEKEQFFKSNPRMKSWVNVFGKVEEMRTFD